MIPLYKILAAFFVADLFLWGCSSRVLGSKARRWVRGAVHGYFAAHILVLAVMYVSAYHPASGLVVPPAIVAFDFIWYFLVAPLAIGAGLLWLAVQAADAGWGFFSPQPASSSPGDADAPGMTRREFLGTAAVLTPPLLAFSLDAFAAAQAEHFRIRRFTLALPSLPRALDGMTIAHLADLHVGPLTHEEMLPRIVEETNKLKADLVLFGGDLINGGDLAYLPQALQTLEGLRPPPILCEGNHDAGQNGSAFDSRVREAGFCLLVDETVTVPVRNHPVQVLGLRWSGPNNWQNRHDEHAIAASMEALLRQRNPGAFPILLAHHPHAWDYCGDIPLTLSGHTHGGQLMLDEQHGLGPLRFRYWSGAYYRPGQALIVNNGVGNWFPLRVGAPAEIVHLTLRCG